MSGHSRYVPVATVTLWHHEVGAIAWDEDQACGRFEYAPAFLPAGLDVAPLTMPLRSGVFAFPELNAATFRGLPGLLSDALPDRFGSAVIDHWLRRHGRDPDVFTPLDRLRLLGARALGALEFHPALPPRPASLAIDVAELTAMAAAVLRGDGEGAFPPGVGDVMLHTAAAPGGARAKAVVAWNPTTYEVRADPAVPLPGFEPWLMKFDGVLDPALGDPHGYGRVEYAYATMAVAAGITMSPCRLLEERGRAHFMTRRFDRDTAGGKLHVQSLCALAHHDFRAPGRWSYEDVFGVIRRLNLGHDTLQEQFRRMVFNVLARNQDDHTRNIAFLMDRGGRWHLSPAFDVVWSYNPTGRWTGQHQMSLAGKRGEFTRADLFDVAAQAGIRDARAILDQVRDAVAHWPQHAAAAAVATPLLDRITATLRLRL